MRAAGWLADGGVVSAGLDGTIRIWAAGQPRTKPKTLAAGGPVVSLVASPDGRRVVAGLGDGVVERWDVAAGKSENVRLRVPEGPPVPEGALPIPGSRFTDMAFAGGVLDGAGGSVFAWEKEGVLHAFDLKERKVVSSRPLERTPGAAFAVLPDGRSILFGTQKDRHKTGVLELIDAKTLRPQRAFVGHAHRVSSVAVSTARGLVVSSSYDQTIRLWTLGSGAELDKLSLHTSQDHALAVALSPDGGWLAAGTARGVILLYRLP